MNTTVFGLQTTSNTEPAVPHLFVVYDRGLYQQSQSRDNKGISSRQPFRIASVGHWAINNSYGGNGHQKRCYLCHVKQDGCSVSLNNLAVEEQVDVLANVCVERFL